MIFRFNATLERCSRVSVGERVYNLIKVNRKQLIGATYIKYTGSSRLFQLYGR